MEIIDVSAEQSILGALIIEGDLLQDVILHPQQLYNKKHQLIYKAMQDIQTDGDALDIVTLTERLGDTLSAIGGVEYLVSLANSVPNTDNLQHYQNIVLEQYRIREARRLASNLLEGTDEEKIAATYNKLGELQEVGVTKTRTKRDVLLKIMDDINTEQKGMTGIDTGLVDLNMMTGGLQDGNLIIVAGRPAMGKTAFALNLALNACKANASASIFSLEMDEEDLDKRLISMEGNVQGEKWKNPYKYFSNEDRQKTSITIAELDELPYEVFDDSRQTLADIRAHIRKCMRQHPDKKHVAVIDYLQLITVPGKFERNDLKIGAVTRELKVMARSLKIPIILLSQLSRSVEQRQDKRPMMSDLRDSGSIEQDADLILFLYRDEYYNKESEKKNMAEAIIAKQRNGPIGNVELAFVKEYGKFLNLSKQEELAL